MVLSVTLLAACGRTAGPSSTTSSTTTTTSSTTTSTTTTTVPVVVDCTATGLGVSLGGGDAALGHVSINLLFKNTGSTACTLTGYPVVALLDSKGNQVVLAVASPSGYMGGLPSGETTPSTVTLTPGATVSAKVEGTDNPVNGATSCPSYSAILVTPPNNNQAINLPLAAAFPDCSGIQVHPVVPGTTGSIS